MINLLIGGPGGGKSYEAVAYHILPALKRGRRVITNLPLIVENLEAVEPGCSALIELREKTLAVEPVLTSQNSIPSGIFGRPAPTFCNRAFANPEDFASTWRDKDGGGPLYVVDECHFVMPRSGTSRAVEEWFSMHRHYNCDVLLITQSTGKISAAIKDLVQVCYKVRKATALGRSSGYIRKVLDGVGGGEVSVSERKYEKQFFKLYKSHTQGLALAEKDADDVAPFSVKFRRISWAFYAFTAVALVWAFWPSGKKPIPRSPGVLIQQSSGLDQPSKVGLPSSGVPPVQSSAVQGMAGVPAAPVVPPTDTPEPFAGKAVHLSGWARMGDKLIHTFVISMAGQRLFELQERELVKAGYIFKPLGECSGYLTFAGVVRAVSCDSPTDASGRNNAPLVMAINDHGEVKTSRD